MAFSINRVEYFYVAGKDKPGEAYRLLSRIAELGVNLLAFTGVPSGPFNTQLTIFPQEPAQLVDFAKKASIHLDGPHLALLVQGDDELGVLASIHEKLFEANVNVYASTGVADGKGSFGYLLYIRPDEYERAVAALGL
jgi:predicted amino acid-binding ACT domain protein